MQAPPSSLLVERASNWSYEFSRPDGSDIMTMTVNAATLMDVFPGLAKGTVYRARVAGINSRGMGQYSQYSMAETLVDRM